MPRQSTSSTSRAGQEGQSGPGSASNTPRAERRAAAEAVTLLEGGGHHVHEGRSERAGHIAEMSAALAEKVDRLLALGGDGTLREAAAGLLFLKRA